MLSYEIGKQEEEMKAMLCKAGFRPSSASIILLLMFVMFVCYTTAKFTDLLGLCFGLS